ncbi:MAG TPA: hypothetical protein VIJ16_03410 [Gemmatimonadaceae bacterium]
MDLTESAAGAPSVARYARMVLLGAIAIYGFEYMRHPGGGT